LIRSSAISRLLSGLRRAPHDYAAPTSIFPSLSVDKLAADMRLQEKGAQRGRMNEPASDSSTFDDVEHFIVERIENEKRLVHASYQDQIQTYAERQVGLDFEGRFHAIRQAAPEVVSEFRAEAAQGRDDLFRLRRQILDREQDRDRFRKVHRLQRSANVSGTAAKLLKIGVICVLSVFELIINGSFLAQGNEQGFLGGVLMALVFALLNIIASFLAGLLVIRQLNHKSILRKLSGFLGLALYLCFAVLLNLALAHYRDASALAGGDAAATAMRQLTSTPLLLHDLLSWVFFAIGVLFSLIAMLDGLTFYDPYPGYEAVERHCILAHENYTARKNDLIDELRDIRDEASEAMKEAARDLGLRRGEFDAIMQARVRLNAAFLDFQGQLARTAQALLSLYREANRHNRSAPAPIRFDTPYVMEQLPVFGETVNESARDDLRKSILQAQDLLTRQVDEINREFDAAVSGYRQIDDMIADGHYGSTQTAA